MMVVTGIVAIVAVLIVTIVVVLFVVTPADSYNIYTKKKIRKQIKKLNTTTHKPSTS